MLDRLAEVVSVAARGDEPGDGVRDSEAVVEDVSPPQFLRRASSDDLSLVKRPETRRGLSDAAGRKSPGQFGIGGRLVALRLRRRDNDGVDEGTRNDDRPGGQGPSRDFPAHLREYLPACVSRRQRQRQPVQRCSLLVEAEIPVAIREAASDADGADRKRLVAKQRPAADFENLDKVLSRELVHLAAFDPGIDEGPESDMGDEPGAARSDLPHQLRDHAGRQHVGLDLVRSGHALHSGRPDPVPPNYALDHPRVPPGLPSFDRGYGRVQADDTLLKGRALLVDPAQAFVFTAEPAQVVVHPLAHLDQLGQRGVISVDAAVNRLDLRGTLLEIPAAGGEVLLDLADGTQQLLALLDTDLHLNGEVLDFGALLLHERRQGLHDPVSVPLYLFERTVVAVELAKHEDDRQHNQKRDGISRPDDRHVSPPSGIPDTMAVQRSLSTNQEERSAGSPMPAEPIACKSES